MMFYIALTGFADKKASIPAKLVKLEEVVASHSIDSGILRARDITRIFWNNLERIDAHIYRDIEQVAITEEYDWTQGRPQTELDALSHEERKRLLFLAARRAGEQNHESLARHRELAMEALEFWREYWQRAVGPSMPSIQPALELYMNPDFDPDISIWSVVSNAQEVEAARRFVDHAVPSIGGSISSEQIVRSLRAGKSHTR